MLIILTGKTASGKDTLIAKILEKYPNFKKVLTTTSRIPRNGEARGVDYNFISLGEFKQKIAQGVFLEHVEYGGNFYGTEKTQINESDNLIWKIDPSMAGKAKDLFPQSRVIYITCDDQTVLERLKTRSLSKEEIQKRMQDDLRFWNLYQDKYDYIVENTPGELGDTILNLSQIIESISSPNAA